jgi:hypothetical protein
MPSFSNFILNLTCTNFHNNPKHPFTRKKLLEIKILKKTCSGHKKLMLKRHGSYVIVHMNHTQVT